MKFFGRETFDQSEEPIRERAYLKWEAVGQPNGDMASTSGSKPSKSFQGDVTDEGSRLVKSAKACSTNGRNVSIDTGLLMTWRNPAAKAATVVSLVSHQAPAVTIMFAAVAVLTIVLHRKNIKRLLNGTEPKFGGPKGDSQEPKSDT